MALTRVSSRLKPWRPSTLWQPERSRPAVKAAASAARRALSVIILITVSIFRCVRRRALAARLAARGSRPQYPTKAERRKYAPPRPETRPLSFVHRLFGRAREREALLPLYEALVREGRDPAWYREGGVPDTLEGRFDMIASVLALVLLRIEAAGDAARRESVTLAEIFIDDMDASLRELGTGDMMVGKKVGKLVGALGGRLGSFRDSAGDPAAFEAAVRRNVFRDASPSEQAVPWVAERLASLRARLTGASLDDVLAGRLA